MVCVSCVRVMKTLMYLLPFTASYTIAQDNFWIVSERIKVRSLAATHLQCSIHALVPVLKAYT